MRKGGKSLADRQEPTVTDAPGSVLATQVGAKLREVSRIQSLLQAHTRNASFLWRVPLSTADLVSKKPGSIQEEVS